MLFIKPKRPRPTPEQIASIDNDALTNVVEVEATVVEANGASDQAGDTPAAPPKPGFTFRKKDKAEPEAQAAKPTKSILGGLFSRRKSADAEAMPPAPEAPKVKAAKPEKKAPKVKPSKPAKSSAKLSDHVYLSLDVGSGSHFYWKVGANTLESVDPLTGGRALSFSPADVLIATDESMSNSAALDLAVSETGEDVVVINASKAYQLVVATAKDRVHGKSLRLAPGVLALAGLLKDQPKPATPRVFGFDLRGGDQHVLILAIWGAGGLTADACQVIVNPGDIGFTVSQFAASRRLNAEDVSTLFFDNAELLAAAAKAPTYANESVFLGLPATKALGVASVLSVAFAAGAAYYAFTQYQAHTTAQQQVAGAQRRMKEAERTASAILEERAHSFVRAQSIDVVRSLRRAQQVWVPGTTVTLEAGRDGDTLEMLMPLVRGAMVGPRPSVAKALTPAELGALVDLSVPKDCTRTGLSVNGTLNEVQLTVTCENGSAGFTRYRLD